MLVIEDVWTAIDKGYEQIAALQFEVAKRAPISGDLLAFKKEGQISMELLAYIESLEGLNLGHSIKENKVIERLYNNIVILTKEIS